MNGRTFAVVGAGLIGGSIARELAARGARVLIHDRASATNEAALAAGVAGAVLPASLDGVEAAEAVFLAVPVGADIDVLTVAAQRLAPGAVIVNAASVQRPAADAATALGLAERYLGAHPLAGDHRAGWHASRMGLFGGARVLLCPTAATGARAMALARELWQTLGATMERVEPHTHDERLAWTSHLPQAVSSAMGAAIARAGVPAARLGPGGRDATRLAASAASVWTPILLANATAVGEALGAVDAALRELADAITRGDAAAVSAVLDEAMHWRTGAAADGSVSDPG